VRRRGEESEGRSETGRRHDDRQEARLGLHRADRREHVHRRDRAATRRPQAMPATVTAAATAWASHMPAPSIAMPTAADPSAVAAETINGVW
jgi:aryl-alcohol dehydrogenase-like predicted oxidoreductase